MLRWVLLLLPVSAPAWADPGVRLGSRGGAEVHDDTDAYVGVDLRLSFPRSPLTINPTFDYFLDAKMTLYQLSVNALYFAPLSWSRVDPFAGVGVNLTSFSFKEHTAGVDNNGQRLGMNLVAGVCVDLPVVSPFVQVVKGLGEIDLLSIGGGLLVQLDGDARWTGCGRRAP